MATETKNQVTPIHRSCLQHSKNEGRAMMQKQFGQTNRMKVISQQDSTQATSRKQIPQR
jgi:hypothetical protein